VGLEEEIKRGGKEGKIVNDYEVYHICWGTWHEESLKIVKQHRMGEKGKEAQLGGYTLTSRTMHIQV
jgi:hypothetical protein